MVCKPGNHSYESRIIGMYSEKFVRVAKISSEVLTSSDLNLGEIIYLATKKCIDSVNSNYNLGIILLCAPVLKALTEKHKSLRKGIKKILHGTNFNECNLIIRAIKYANPAGLKNYEGSSNILKNKLNNKNIIEVMKVSSTWDRISKCYVEDYSEILDFGLPLFINFRRRLSKKKAIQLLYLSYAANSMDSHILRKYGSESAKKVLKMFKVLNAKIFKNYKINYDRHIRFIDTYLKKLNLNPGTCADLTVTTLLIYKIKDIFYEPL